MSALSSVNLILVETADDAVEFMHWLGERRPILGFDTETTGLDWWTPNFLRMAQFGDGQTGWAIDARNWRGLIDQALSKYDGPIVAHNAPFDMHAIEVSGLPMPAPHQWHDTKIMDYIVEPRRSHALKQVTQRYWPDAAVGQDLLRKEFRKTKTYWDTIPTNNEIYWTYAALDPVLAARLFEEIKPEALPMWDSYEREMAALMILYRAERKGLRIDPNYTYNLQLEWEQEMEILRVELDKMGLANPNAGLQVAQAMQLTEDWEPDAWTDTGLPKVDEKVLLGIDSEISRRVLRYRRLRKWTSSYLDRFYTQRDSEDRLHASINTAQARTGRMSITRPALQTLPRGPIIRNCIIPSDGQALWACDYDTMEMRVFAHYANETGLIEAVHSGMDLHTFAAQEVYGDPSITKDDPRRQLAKNTQFGLIYGAGPAKIAETAHVTEAEARAFLQMYENRFSQVRPFMRQVDAHARERRVKDGRAYVRSWGGRTLPADDDKLYALVNYLIQGSCADVLKQKIIDLDNAGYGDNILIPVHDELLVEFPIGEVDGPHEVKEIMEDYNSFVVPLTCELSGPYERWGAKYEKKEA